MRINRRYRRRSLFDDLLAAAVGLAVGLLVAAITILGTFDKAHAAGGHQPYGGCDESINYVSTAGADWCRDHGWTVTKHIVVDPNGWVRAWHHLDPCRYEDPTIAVHLPCRWNFGPGQMGNGKGDKFWVSRGGRTHYVKGVL